MGKRFAGWNSSQEQRLKEAGKIGPEIKCNVACGPGDMWAEHGGCICDRRRIWEEATRRGQAATTEEALHDCVLAYIRARYPWSWANVHSDLSGFRLGIKAQARLGRLGQSRGFPDIVIYEARGEHQGLALELKKTGARIRLKNGSLSQDIHIQEQEAWLERFRLCGFSANFVIGFDGARSEIDRYCQLARKRDQGQDPPGAGSGPVAG